MAQAKKKKRTEFDPQELLGLLETGWNWTIRLEAKNRRRRRYRYLAELVEGNDEEPFHQSCLSR